MLPVQIRIVSPLRAVTLTNQNMSFALRRVESSWKSCFKIIALFAIALWGYWIQELANYARSFYDTIKEWCSTNMLEVISSSEALDLHVPSQVAF